MNILHMKYAVEIANAGSINKASEALLVAQPNLSRSVKELEADLGITIFERSAHGMTLTHDGEEFIGYAKSILRRIDEVEAIYKSNAHKTETFSISVPRASYICDAFSQFTKSIGKEPIEIFYKETNSQRAINNILYKGYKLGILRYASNYDKYFKEMLEEKGLHYELITEFKYVLAMSEKHDLAEKEDILYSDLSKYIEIAHADPFVPSLPPAEVKKEESPDNTDRRIFVFERASQFELLSENPETFMWVSPMPEDLLKRYGLVQKSSSETQKVYKDVLIYRKDYSLSDLDRRFITELCMSKRKYI